MDSPSWRREFARGLGALWPVKLAGTPAFMTAFFVCYFFALNHPIFPVTVMPVTALDRWIGFHPASLALYVSLWLYVLLPSALIGERSELARYALAATVLAVAGLAVFVAWPTAVPKWDAAWSHSGAFARLKSVDASGNACPSLHAGFAVFSAIWIGRLLRRAGAPAALRFLNGCWCLAILYSTMATRQHVAIDVLAGSALGWLVALLMRPRPVRLS